MRHYLIAGQNIKVILVLGFAYSSVISFPIFGPVLHKIFNVYEIIFVSILSLAALTMGFLLPSNLLLKNISYKVKLLILSAATISAALISSVNATSVFILLCCLIVFTAGRTAHYWSESILINIPNEYKGRIIGTSLFIAYGILYMCNVIVPSLPLIAALLISPILLLISVLQLMKCEIPYNADNYQEQSSKKPANQKLLYFFIFMIYITAGITYGGVYPKLQDYYYIDRYYNVLPFVIAASFAGFIADSRGRKYLLYIGLSLLGISFAFFALNYNIYTYVIIQTAIQTAWAFLDIYAWVIFADIAHSKKSNYIFMMGISIIMWGVSTGAFISYLCASMGTPSNVLFSFFTHIPLFFSIAILSRVPDTLIRKDLLYGNALEEASAVTFDFEHPAFDKLTPREKEIIILLAKGLENSQICEQLYISNNTVKTHIRNIYRKLNVSNRKELKSKIQV